MDLKNLGEFGLIARLRERPGVEGIGDDAAVIPFGEETLLITTDTVVEGVHFRRSTISMTDLGYKVAAANLSDIAAMGGIPLGAVAALSLPGRLTVEEIDDLYDGMREAADPHRVDIRGGDITSSPESLVITITMWGKPAGPAPILRSGAQPGDRLLLSGYPGESALGLHLLEIGDPGEDLNRRSLINAHRRPLVRPQLGTLLGKIGGVKAMIDTSDGLLLDLSHIGEESRVGAIIDVSAVPLSGRFVKVAREIGLDPVNIALTGGEDYLLLAAVDPSREVEIRRAAVESGLGPLFPIGEITAESGIRLRETDGMIHPAPLGGWVHF